MFIQTQPMHWDNELGRSNFYVGSWLSFLSHNVLSITYQLWNGESFAIHGGHELPVAYLDWTLGSAKAYVGPNPFSNAPISEIPVPVGPGNSPVVNATERWVGWFGLFDLAGIGVGEAGVALYVPQTSYSQVWRVGKIASPPTSYIQNVANWSLAPNTPYTTTVYLITGTPEEIRSAVYALEGY